MVAEQMASQNIARFYFNLTFELASRDITKIETVNQLKMYLCLATASLLKDEVIRQQEEMRKMNNPNSRTF